MDNGVYFVNQDTQKRLKVDASDIVTNNPGELIIVIPALNSGAYRLEITTRYAVSMLLKEPGTVIFDRILTVEQ